MKELFESLEKVMESQQKQINILGARCHYLENVIDLQNEYFFKEEGLRIDEECFKQFDSKHGEKFKDIDSLMQKTPGNEKYSASRKTYNDLKNRKSEPDFNEDVEVDKILADTIRTLDALKAKFNPEQAAAIEEIKEEVKEAALINDAANSDGDSANENVSEETDEWAGDMEEEWKKHSSKKGY